LTDPFISAEELAAFLHDTEGGLVDDLAAISMDSACQVVRDYTKQTLDLVEDAELTVVIRSDGVDAILLPEMPVMEVTEVTQADRLSDGTYDEPETLTADVDYELGAAGILYRMQGESWTGKVVVTYTHGYENVPSSVQLVALSLAARLYRQMEKPGFDNEVGPNPGQVQAGLTAAERRVLDHYRDSNSYGHAEVPAES
jgi:hypothetical protein